MVLGLGKFGARHPVVQTQAADCAEVLLSDLGRQELERGCREEDRNVILTLAFRNVELIAILQIVQ